MKILLSLLLILALSGLKATTTNDPKMIIDSILTKARIISSQNISKAEQLLTEAYDMAIEEGYLQGKAEAIRLQGLIMFFRVDYPAAHKLFLESKEKFIEANDTKGKARAYNNIAVSFSYQGFYQQALQIYEEIADIYKSINDTIGLASVYNNMATNYKSLEDYSTVLHYNHKAIGLYLQVDADVSREISRTYNNLGILYLTKEVPDSAYYYLNKSLKIRKEINEVQGIKNTYQYLGRYYFDQGNYRQAKSYLEKSMDIAKQIEISYEIESAAKDIFPVYYKLGMYKEAFEALLLYNEMQKESKTEEAIKMLTSIELETRFEKEQELQRLIQAEKDYENQLTMERQIRVRNTLIASVISLFLIAYLIYRGYRIKRKHVGVLNKQNAEIIEKNEELKMNQQEILAQRDEIEKQRSMLESYNNELKNANKKMLDNIKYAETLQKTIFPHESELRNFCNDYFIIYKPCEIVSGDFYWYEKYDNLNIFALADCTGHGVPGALMTMIATGIMKKIILDKKAKDPASALKDIHNEVAVALKQNEDHYHNLDGLDMALLFINQTEKTLTYAGAYIPLYLHNGNGIEKIEPDKASIGGIKKKKEVSFRNNKIILKGITRLYLLSDGYTDQMSPEGKRIGRASFENLLKEACSLPMNEQKKLFENNWLKHKKDENQIDDTSLVGLEIKI